MNLIKPKRLRAGDKVMTTSLSWGGAGDPELLWRYRQGKEYIQNTFGLEVVEAPHALMGSDYLYAHPEKRAEDLMEAFADPSVKGIFSCIGGCESIRMLPHIEFDVIRRNAKVFVGYSDTTITHFICLKAGISSFYGPSILAEFAENGGMHGYTVNWLQRALFSAEPIGRIDPPDVWTSEYLPWLEENKHKRRAMVQNTGYELLQGMGQATGPLIGGCIEVMEMMKGTELWPGADIWKGAILFFETSEDRPEPNYLEYWLRNYGCLGILQNCNGIIFGKPYDMKHYDEYKRVITKVVRTELALHDLPVLCNAGFGHTSPMAVLPYGAMAEIDCAGPYFSILERGAIS